MKICIACNNKPETSDHFYNTYGVCRTCQAQASTKLAQERVVSQVVQGAEENFHPHLRGSG